MEELKPACSSPGSDEDDTCEDPENGTLESESDDDFGADLSIPELKVAKEVTYIVSETLKMIQKLNRVIKNTIKLEKPRDTGVFVDSLEKLLKLCQGIGVGIDELGACVYPPQELRLMIQTLERMRENVGEIIADVLCFKNFSLVEAFFVTCRRLQSSITYIEVQLDRRIGPSGERNVTPFLKYYQYLRVPKSQR
ncbi:hypothetical protein AALP_AA2G144100 [Arabis alpina]|uniref:Cyclin-D1-binding protein 1-like C-terminal domain-containing protein n=1 Tax=Arabis alpina TaxID=50452 RepID=A0A087HHF0_ARAAL|nr:hypothetical protein AALP_AA2G144100 [Arabis alpina]